MAHITAKLGDIVKYTTPDGEVLPALVVKAIGDDKPASITRCNEGDNVVLALPSRGGLHEAAYCASGLPGHWALLTAVAEPEPEPEPEAPAPEPEVTP